MMFESVFMIRGGSFGEEFGLKLILGLAALAACIYDWRKNKRWDYLWVYLFATVIWAGAELMLQLGGTRVFQEKFFFGINITEHLWFTVSLQGMSEAALVTTIGLFIGDRILNKESRKGGFLIIIILFAGLVLQYLRGGINFMNVIAGDLSIPSRRDMFPLMANIFIGIMCALAIIWLITADSATRKRGLMIYFTMAGFIAWWTLMEWLAGQRWIEVGTVNSDGSYSNLRRADAMIEFLALAYDFIIEVSLIYVPFVSIPYWFKLIKTEEI